jgi:hypothetical protein
MVALQRGLSISQMPASVADALPCALASLSFRRVVFPGLSVTQSQLLHLALTLRLAYARSQPAHVQEHAHEALRGFLAQCELVQSVLGDGEGEEHENAVRRYPGLAGDAGADGFAMAMLYALTQRRW